MKRLAIIGMILGLSVPTIGMCETSEALHANPTKPDWTIVNRCSHAAALAVFAAETFPDDQKKRVDFVMGILPKLPERLQEQSPGLIEVMTANASVTGLISLGQNPKIAQNRDWLMAQAAATCALGVMRAPASK
jgi:hypothetical protein